MKAAGIPKRDERERTVDVHALRTTFGTMLSRHGVAPRTAQAAMRHSDIKLTMNTCADPKLLEVGEALERLPALATGLKLDAPPDAPSQCKTGHAEASYGTTERICKSLGEESRNVVTAYPVNKNTPLTSCDISGAPIELTGFEPATSWSRTKRSTKLSYSSLNRGVTLKRSARKSTSPY